MIRRIVLIPVYSVLMAAKVIVGMIIRMSGWFFYLLGGLFLLVTILCYCFGLESGESLKRMVISSGIMFIVPLTASALEGILEFCTMVVEDRIGGR